jgi:hypothetical protein
MTQLQYHTKVLCFLRGGKRFFKFQLDEIRIQRVNGSLKCNAESIADER